MEIIRRDRRRPRFGGCGRIRFICMTQRQNFDCRTELRFAECCRLFLGEYAKFAGTRMNRRSRNVIQHRLRRRPGTNGIREDVQIGKRTALDELDRCGVVFGGFPGETRDNVSADRGVGKLIANKFDSARVVFGAIPAMHRGKYAVGAGLQRHVEVLRDARRRSEQRNQVGSDVERFDRADTKTRDVGFVEDATQQIFKFYARSEIAAPRSQVDAAEDDFAIAPGGEAADFSNDFARRHAAAFAANKWNHAIRTAKIAAVLDLQRGARVIRFAAKNRSGEEFGPVENVCGKDFGIGERVE